jgi:hypothetical protein
MRSRMTNTLRPSVQVEEMTPNSKHDKRSGPRKADSPAAAVRLTRNASREKRLLGTNRRQQIQRLLNGPRLVRHFDGGGYTAARLR